MGEPFGTLLLAVTVHLVIFVAFLFLAVVP
jgi:hypothetical protein